MNDKGNESQVSYMIEERIKRRIILAILAVGTIVVTAVLILQDVGKQDGERQQGIIYFANATAQPGLPVEVVALNYPLLAQPCCEWKVDGKLIDNSGFSYTPSEEDVEKMITVTVRAEGYEEQTLSVYCSYLPVLYVNTDDGSGIEEKSEYKSGYYVLQGAGERLHDNYEGKVWVKGRGNHSWKMPKRPYRLKLDSEENFWEMGANRHWTLIANYVDVSLMRNALSYWMAEEMGLVSMKSQWVSLVFNGEYAGNYQLCQQIRPGEDRIPITDFGVLFDQAADALSEENSSVERELLRDRLEEDLSWMSTGVMELDGQEYVLPGEVKMPDLTGGFILEIDMQPDEKSCFNTRMEQPVMFHTPENAWSNQTLMDFTIEYIQAFEDAVYAEDHCVFYRGQRVHYSDLIDMDSLVKYWLVSEYFFNKDFGKKSVYLYKDIGQKAFMGPIWDMDLSSGSEEPTSPYDQWTTFAFNEKGQRLMWYKPLVKDPYFVERAYQLYHQYRDVFQKITEDGGMIDEYYAYLSESGRADSARWERENGRTFDQDAMQILKPWCQNRLEWLDRQFASGESLMRSLSEGSLKVPSEPEY